MRRLKAVCLLLCAGLQGLPAAAAPTLEDGDWSGNYRLDWIDGSPAAEDGATSALVSIHRAPSVDTPQTSAQALGYWVLGPTAEPDDGLDLRQFLPKEYLELGLGNMYAQGSIACLDGGPLFICRVPPQTEVVFGDDANRETLYSRTGVFGVRFHAGGFELTKLDSKP